MEDKNTESMVCPITKEIMVDPVRASDGITYEREAISKFIKNNPGAASPVTGKPLTESLEPNTHLKNIIQETLAKAAQGLSAAMRENPQLAERIQKIKAEAIQNIRPEGALNTQRFDFSGLPKDVREHIILGYLKRLPLSERKQLAELGNKELFEFLKGDIKLANAKVQELLHHVVTANVKAAKMLLDADPGLSLEEGVVEDLSGRKMLIKPFQYAVWAQHPEMRKMIAEHLTYEQAQKQFQEQMDPENENTKMYGKVCPVVGQLFQKLEANIKKYKDMQLHEYQLIYSPEKQPNWEAWWAAGQIQRLLPACVVLRCSQLGGDASWCKKDIDSEVPWVEEDLKGWFAPENADQCIIFRGRMSNPAQLLEGGCGETWRAPGNGERIGWAVFHDAEVFELLMLKQEQELAKLMAYYGESPSLSKSQ